MLAIEFTSQSHNRMIPIPEQHKDWFKKSVKVILLATESSSKENVMPEQTLDLKLSAEQQAARQRSLERMKRGYPLGIAGMKREQFYD